MSGQVPRTVRTVRHLRAEQWVGRARRHLWELTDRALPALSRRLLAEGRTVRLRSGLKPAWPRVDLPPGSASIDTLLDQGPTVLGEPVRLGQWHASDPLRTVLLHSHAFLVPLVEDGRPEAVRLARLWVDTWMQDCPAPQRPAWSPWCAARRVAPWLRLLTLAPSPEDGPRVACLGEQLMALEQRLERDLGGNHLWEDAAALYLGGQALEGSAATRWRTRGEHLLRRCLTEQLLPDGGHYERSAMYHALLLQGLLDLLAFDRPDWLVQAAGAMTTWLSRVTGPDDRLPQLNDCAPGLAPPVSSLLAAAAQQGLTAAPRDEGANLDGWMLCRQGAHHLVFDAAPVGPDDQPGHGHADTTVFECTVAGQPIVVDPGTAGYAGDPYRAWSRSTAAHGVVQVGHHDSAEVWSVFRIGRRPRHLEREGPVPVAVKVGRAWRMRASHDGYRHLDAEVARHLFFWCLDADRAVLVVRDFAPDRPLTSRLPLAPGLDWDATTGALSGVRGSLQSWGFEQRHCATAQVAERFGLWRPARVAVGEGRGETGWVLAVGAGLQVEALDALVVRIEGVVVAELGREAYRG